MIDMHIPPGLSDARLEQMVHFATSLQQEKKRLGFWDALFSKRGMTYGFGSALVTASVAGLLLMNTHAQKPTVPLKQKVAAEISDYMIYDLLDDLS